jgi:hypothetical protein
VPHFGAPAITKSGGIVTKVKKTTRSISEREIEKPRARESSSPVVLAIEPFADFCFVFLAA